MLNDGKYIECEKLGLEAIHVLPEQLIIRGKIADLTLKASEKLEHTNIIKESSIAAFYSESTLNNYLRFFELPDYKNIANEAVNHIKTLPEKLEWREYYDNKQLQINKLSNIPAGFSVD